MINGFRLTRVKVARDCDNANECMNQRGLEAALVIDITNMVKEVSKYATKLQWRPNLSTPEWHEEVSGDCGNMVHACMCLLDVDSNAVFESVYDRQPTENEKEYREVISWRELVKDEAVERMIIRTPALRERTNQIMYTINNETTRETIQPWVTVMLQMIKLWKIKHACRLSELAEREAQRQRERMNMVTIDLTALNPTPPTVMPTTTSPFVPQTQPTVMPTSTSPFVPPPLFILPGFSPNDQLQVLKTKREEREIAIVAPQPSPQASTPQPRARRPSSLALSTIATPTRPCSPIFIGPASPKTALQRIKNNQRKLETVVEESDSDEWDSSTPSPVTPPEGPFQMAKMSTVLRHVYAANPQTYKNRLQQAIMTYKPEEDYYPTPSNSSELLSPTPLQEKITHPDTIKEMTRTQATKLVTKDDYDTEDEFDNEPVTTNETNKDHDIDDLRTEIERLDAEDARKLAEQLEEWTKSDVLETPEHWEKTEEEIEELANDMKQTASIEQELDVEWLQNHHVQMKRLSEQITREQKKKINPAGVKVLLGGASVLLEYLMMAVENEKKKSHPILIEREWDLVKTFSLSTSMRATATRDQRKHQGNHRPWCQASGSPVGIRAGKGHQKCP